MSSYYPANTYIGNVQGNNTTDQYTGPNSPPMTASYPPMQRSPGGFEGSQQAQPQYPRFPPYDRLDIRPINSSQAQQYYNQSSPCREEYTQNGQAMPQYNSCKLQAEGDLGVESYSVNPPPPPAQPQQNNNNSPQQTTIPIYPWMRSQFGKYILNTFSFLLKTFFPTF